MNVANFIFFTGALFLWAAGVVGVVYGLYQWGPGNHRFGMAVWKGLMVWAASMLLGGVLFLIGMAGNQWVLRHSQVQSSQAYGHWPTLIMQYFISPLIVFHFATYLPDIVIGLPPTPVGFKILPVIGCSCLNNP